MTSARLLFLDIDGVLNSTRYWWASDRSLPLGQAGALDPEAIERLNRIVDETDCKVVLSSTWRGTGDARQRAVVEAMLQERGYRHRLYGMTPLLWTERHKEIGEVIDRLQPDRFVVLDDDSDAWADSFAGWGVFIRTDYRIGLQDDGAAAAIEWLKAA